MSSYKTGWILSEFHVTSSCTTNWFLTEPLLPAPSCLLYHKDQLSDECTCMRMASRNLYKFKQFIYCVFCLRWSLQSCYCLFICLSAILYCTLLLFVYLFAPLFFFFFFIYNDVIVIFCLSINHANKPIIFVFGTFVYNFKNTISTHIGLAVILSQNFREIGKVHTYIIDHYNYSIRITT